MDDDPSLSAFLALDEAIDCYIQERRCRIDGFICDHFSLPKVIALQRASLWRDLFCYPLNMLWAIPYMALRKLVEALDKIGLEDIQTWFSHVPPRILTHYQKKIEQSLALELLEWPYVIMPGSSERHALLDRLRTHPKLGPLFSDRNGAHPPVLPMEEFSQLMDQYSLGRVYIMDLVASALALGIGWMLFHDRSLTLFGVSQRVARKIAQEKAAGNFVLGHDFGLAWYGLFPPEPSMIDLILAGLVLGCVLTVVSFVVGVASEPVRSAFGLHKKNLNVLLDRLDERLRLHLTKELKRALGTSFFSVSP